MGLKKKLLILSWDNSFISIQNLIFKKKNIYAFSLIIWPTWLKFCTCIEQVNRNFCIILKTSVWCIEKEKMAENKLQYAKLIISQEQKNFIFT